MIGRRWLGVCAMITALSVGGRAVHADKNLDTGVGQLDPGEWRVGLWRVNRGMTGKLAKLQIGTATLPYVAWALGLPTANVELKYAPWRAGRWRTEVASGVTWMRLANTDDVEVSLFVVPVDARVAWTKGRWAVHSGLTANLSTSNASLDLEKFGGAAGLVGTTVYLPMGVRWEPSRRVTLMLERRFFMYQTFGVTAETMLDDRTNVQVYGEVGINGRGMTSLDALFHLGRAHLKLGISRGDVEIPIIKAVVPARAILPRLDFYVRF